MRFTFLRKKPKTGSSTQVHLDYASATPVDKEVLVAMQPYFAELWANPSAIYKKGVQVRSVIEEHRTLLARTLHVRPHDVTFTSGGTEANNAAIIGLVEALHAQGRAYSDMEIITTKIEHPSVLEALEALKCRGVRVVYAPVQEDGLIDIQVFRTMLTEKTILVTIAYVNSEIGVVQDVKKITRIVRKWNDAHQGQQIFVHTDACQAPLWLPCALDMLGVDFMSLDAGKCYGPKGIGVLVHRHWVPLAPILYGGGQEGGLRSGTENTALIVGCVRSFIRAQDAWETRASRVQELREYGIHILEAEIPGVVLNGSREARVANNINISLPGIDTEYATIWLDARGIAVSTKSTCGVGDSTGSKVVREISNDEARARATLRITLGEDSKKHELDMLVSFLKEYLVLMKMSK